MLFMVFPAGPSRMPGDVRRATAGLAGLSLLRCSIHILPPAGQESLVDARGILAALSPLAGELTGGPIGAAPWRLTTGAGLKILELARLPCPYLGDCS